MGKNLLFLLYLLHHPVFLLYQPVLKFQDTAHFPLLNIIGVKEHDQAETKEDDQTESPAEQGEDRYFLQGKHG